MSENGREKRSRKPPTRLGVGDNYDSFPELRDEDKELSDYADDSIEDVSYVPEVKEKVVATVKKAAGSKFTTVKMPAQPMPSNIPLVNFDEMFGGIESDPSEQVKSYCEKDSTADRSAGERHEDICSTASNDGMSIVNSNSPSEIQGIRKSIDILLTISKEILGRIKRLENRVLEKEINSDISNLSPRMSEQEVFLKNIGLPLTGIESVNKFNDVLHSSETRKCVVSF